MFARSAATESVFSLRRTKNPLCFSLFDSSIWCTRTRGILCTGKTCVCHSTIRLDSRAKVPSPFQWTRPRCHRCSLSLIQSPLSLASYELSAPPRVVTLPRAFLSHLVSNCSFSFVLKQGYYENSLILGKKVLISLFYCDLSNGQIYRILVWNVSIVLHCSLFTSANSLTQATIKYR